MLSREFDWDAGNLWHATRHGPSRQQIEEALQDPHLWPNHPEIREGELRAEVYGRTLQGRILVVVVTDRDGRTRPVAAYYARGRKLSLYEEGRR